MDAVSTDSAVGWRTIPSSRSTSRTERFRVPSSIAFARPTGPPPTITTSYAAESMSPVGPGVEGIITAPRSVH
jgi:hypothetical protein